jgi:hypothetical protein
VSRRADDSSGNTGSRARARRRSERRLRHLRELALAAAYTQASAEAAGVECLGDLDVNPFEQAARAVIDEHKRGRLTDADVASLGLREADDGSLWIRVGPPWGRG